MLTASTHSLTHESVILQFLPQCDNVAIMDEGNMVYFGPWDANAQRLLNEYLPVSHLLAAGGAAEQPKGDKKAGPKGKVSSSEAKVKEEPPKVTPVFPLGIFCLSSRKCG